MEGIWNILNKIAIVGTILGIPATLYGIYSLIFDTVIVYDAFRELNSSGGYTLSIGSYTRRDYKNGKKENPNRQFHIKGQSMKNDTSWK